MSDSCWDPKQYEKFKQQRLFPFLDLIDLIEHEPGMEVLDLGCGTGENSRTLFDELGAKGLLGVDNSETMLAKAEGFARDGMRFELGAIEDVPEDGQYDLVFSNAALHFVKGHHELFPKLFRMLKPGGQLAVHLPSNHTYHTHVLAAEMGAEEPFASALKGENYRSAVLLPEEYAELLYETGFEDQTVRLNIYTHELPEPRAVYEWVKGSLLTWYQRRLPEELGARFQEEYERRLLARLKDTKPFFFTFRRTLIWARKPGA